MPQIVRETTWLQKHRRGLRLALIFGGPILLVLLIMAGWVGYIYIKKLSPTATKPHVKSPPVVTPYAPTAEQIRQAQQNVSTEGTVTAVSETSLTIKELGTSRSVKLTLSADTTYTKTSQYTPADRAGLQVGSHVSAYYNSTANQAISVAYDL